MQTINTELAKKFKKLGVEQNSYAVWFFNPDSNLDKRPYIIPKTDLPNRMSESTEVYSAFTLDEILSMLPKVIKRQCCCRTKVRHNLTIVFHSDEYTAGHTCSKCSYCSPACSFMRKDSAQAAGNLLAWCIEGCITEMTMNEQLSEAAIVGDLEGMQRCMDKGANALEWALWYASSYSQLEAMKLCMECGADNLNDSLMVANKYNQPEAVELLKQWIKEEKNNANINK